MKKSLHELTENFSGSQAYDHEFGILLSHNMAGFVDRGVAQKLRELEPKATPPSNNMGGTDCDTPLHFPHGEKSAAFCKQKTKIDWFGFTSSADVEAVKLLVSTIWPDVVFSRKVGGGMPGYPDAYLITVDSVQYGLLGTGAAHGRHFVSLSGTACKTLTDELVQIFYDALTMTQLVAGVPVSVFDPRISRIDLCFDSYRGEITYDDALAAYYEGAFMRPQARRNPELKKVSVSADRNLGRTMYVGKRDGHVMGRIYEKGLEVFAKLPEELRLMSEDRDGDICGPMPADDWLRLEAEFKRVDKDRPLPLEMMLERDTYFAGAYPFFASALGMADGVRPAGLKSEFSVDLAALMHNCSRSYGSLIHSLTELGFTDSQVVEHLTSGRNNDKLVRSGLLREAKQAFDAVAALDPDFDIPF